MMPSSKFEFSKFDFLLPARNKEDSVPQKKKITDFDINLVRSYITLHDIKALVPELKLFDDRLNFSAHLTGNETNINLDKLNIAFGKGLTLTTNAEIKDYNDPQKTYIKANINNFSFSGNDVKIIIDNFLTNPINLPAGILEQERMAFKGNIHGPLNNILAFGALTTAQGVLETNIALNVDNQKKYLKGIKGKLFTHNYKLGTFISQRNLNNISFNIDVDLKKEEKRPFHGFVKGNITDFDFKGYRYDDIHFDFNQKNNLSELALTLNDENLSFDLTALYNTANKTKPISKLDLILKNINLEKTNLVPKWKNTYGSLHVHSDLEGKNINNVNGSIRIDSLNLYKDNQHLFIDSIQVNAIDLENKNKRITINSNLLNGCMEGIYDYTKLALDFKYILNNYLPEVIRLPKNKNYKVKNDAKLHLTINETTTISRFLDLPLTLYDQTSIDALIETDDNSFNINIQAPRYRVDKNFFESTSIQAKTYDDQLHLGIQAKMLGKNSVVNNITLNAIAQNNRIDTYLNLKNNHKNKIDLNCFIRTNLEYDKKKKALEATVNLKDNKITINNESWLIDNSEIIIKPKNYTVNNFNIHNKNYSQELKIQGEYAIDDSEKEINITLKDINLEYIFETLAIDALQFGGQTSGNLMLSSVEKKPYATTELNVKNFKFNNTLLGDLKLNSILNEETNQVLLNGIITTKEKKKTYIDGFIDPINKDLSINFDADSMNIRFLDKYLGTLFNDIQGYGTGTIHLHGNFSKVTVSGVADIKGGKIGIKMLNTDYYFSDKIYLNDDLIYFNDIKFTDNKGNVAYAEGKVVHNYFSDIVYYVEMNADDFLVFNGTEAANPVFYGQVYGSGKAMVSGDETAVNIDVNLKTEKNTSVYMNFLDNSINEYSFIKFREDPNKIEEDNRSEFIKDYFRDTFKAAGSDMDVNMNFYVEATPEASFELLMDPVGGDVIKGSGEGAMTFKWSTKLPPELYGTFNLNRGVYRFTFQRIMERTFNIRSGSSIRFSGDPFKAILDVNAIYKVTASLSDLDKDLVKFTGQSSVPTNCVLKLNGELQHPTIKLDIEFPTLNEEVQRQVKTYMDTEDMINKQVTYLLILSKFYTPDIGSVDKPSNDFTVLASATLSNQLSKIINKVDNRWQLGTHIRMSDTELTRTEVELLLSSQLLNDRLLINGNFGYRDDPLIQSDAVVTDIDIEFLLNTAGTWRLKAYNHYNEKFYYLQTDKGIQTQGVGIVYQKDFDRFSDIFKRKKTEAAKKGPKSKGDLTSNNHLKFRREEKDEE